MDNKDRSVYSSSAAYAAEYEDSSVPGLATENDRKVTGMEKQDKALKKNIRIFRFVSRFISVFLNLYLIGSMCYALAKYYLTRDKILPGNVHPWSTPTRLWPTFMLLAIAIVTFFMNLLTLFAYMCGVGASNRVNTIASALGYVFLGVHVVVWAVVAGAFKMASNGQDLWGYSCNPITDVINTEESFVDFGKLCTIQGGSWYVSIIETGVYFLTFVTTILMARRYAHKKKLKQMRESMLSMEAVNGPNIEAETSYNPSLGRQYIPVGGQSQHF